MAGLWPPGYGLLDALMRPRLVEVGDVLLENTAQVLLAQEQDVIEALTAHAPEEAFADRIRTRCLDRCAQHLDPGSRGDGSEVRTVVLATRVIRLKKGAVSCRAQHSAAVACWLLFCRLLVSSLPLR